jgi:hypothetical protein
MTKRKPWLGVRLALLPSLANPLASIPLECVCDIWAGIQKSKFSLEDQTFSCFSQ